ncbi:MAG TPA: type VI secretion system protein TssA [Longimicrobiaceae bacterium]|nr:type VI secretion system protein TssA [Longimicrobiaceae bacterium]
MPLREDLLAPIAEDRPGGDDIRYEPVYDQIKEARREDEDLPTRGWETARKLADWPLVVKLASEVLAKRSKDLQVAVWLSEAQLQREGVIGLRESLALIRGLLDQYWESLYPELEDGDAEFRAAPLEWLGSRLDVAVRSVPLDRSGHTFLQYQEGRKLGYEEEATDGEKKKARQAEIDAGKLPPEQFDQGFNATPKEWYRTLVADLEGTLAELRELDDLGREKFGEFAPSYRTLRGALEEVLHTAKLLLARKLETDPDPVELEAPAPTAEPAEPGEPAAAGAAATLPEPASGSDAASRVAGVARHLRQQAPTDPTPYLLLRALRFGEVRAQAGALDPKLLEAPSGPTRTQLKGLLLQGAWPQLIDAAEQVMATPAGRGWLDLQRYVVAGCRELGPDYDAVARAVLDELRALLSAVPELLDATLMDDMPTATPETRDWIRAEVLSDARPAVETEASAASGGPDRVFARAQAEASAGNVSRAIELLMRALDHETSRRGRFLRQTQLARILVETELEGVALPILQEMMGLIEAHKLEEWEAGSLVGQPIALLHRVFARLEGDAGEMRKLYLRLCRLDPVQAIGLNGR